MGIWENDGHNGKWAFGDVENLEYNGHLGQMAKEHSGQVGSEVNGDLGQIGCWGK